MLESLISIIQIDILNMMNVIRMHGSGGPGFLTLVGVGAGIALVVLSILKNRGKI